MRLLYVPPRYGAEVYGGAERLTAAFAERMATRGHEVHVLTSCARSYVDWADVDEPGDTVENGVQVHRLPVERTRSDELNSGVVFGDSRRWYLQDEWSRLTGPALRGGRQWLQRHTGDMDVVLPVTYQHRTTWDAVMLSRAPIVLHPTAHPEITLEVGLFDVMTRGASAMALLTPEEKDLVQRRFRIATGSLEVVGMGVEPLTASPADVDQFLATSGLGKTPYVVCVGRTDAAKGSLELADLFATFKQRNPGPLRLVFAGEEVHRVPHHPDIVTTGALPIATRNAAVAGALALVQPSWFESFSLVLMDAWQLGVSALVQGRSDVLRGHARRSGGAIPYSGYAEFEAGLQLLLEQPGLRERLAHAGSEYVEREYRWADVLGRYESLLERVVA